MNVIDCGVAVLSMHAPWEATSKADIYETKCGYVAFFGESVPVMEMEGLKTSDYYFDLPKELIAQDPLEDRSASRLLVMDRQTGATSHHIFKEICSFLKPGDCLVFKQHEGYSGASAWCKGGYGSRCRNPAVKADGKRCLGNPRKARQKLRPVQRSSLATDVCVQKFWMWRKMEIAW